MTQIKQLNVRLPESLDKRLAILAVEHGTSKQALAIEALEDLLEKYKEE